MADKIYMNLALSIECFMKKKPYPATWQNFWLEIAATEAATQGCSVNNYSGNLRATMKGFLKSS